MTSRLHHHHHRRHHRRTSQARSIRAEANVPEGPDLLWLRESEGVVSQEDLPGRSVGREPLVEGRDRRQELGRAHRLDE